MAIIHELSSHLADLIAAGEVVERPASVAKELIENAIDAKATRITVEIENGGISYLRIADNGSGMSAEDAPVAFKRHATSKLRTEADLSAIGTLGFRGEALAAIASVSKIDLFTRENGAISGLHLCLEAGQIMTNEDAGCPEGTTIIIRDLFYNTPARMKFLKKDFTEAGYILGVVQHAALSHPEIAFTLIRDGKQVFTTDGKNKLIVPIFAVFGKETTANMIHVPQREHEGISVHGYVVKPHAGRANRSMQHFFVNGRYIKSKLIQAALEQAYRNAMITGKYPSGAVFLTIPLAAVDVNVHPAKTEVKFSQEKPVFEAVYAAVKNALSMNDNMPEIKHKDTAIKEDNLSKEQQRFSAHINHTGNTKDFSAKAIEPEKTPPLVPQIEDFLISVPQRADWSKSSEIRFEAPSIVRQEPMDFSLANNTQAEKAYEEVQITDKTENKSSPFAPLDEGIKVIGECFHTYIVAEDKEGLILIDKHAAHERILFNKLRAETEIPQQQLLTPSIVEMTAEETAALKEHLDEIRKIGFSIDEFGENSFAVRSMPAYLDAEDAASTMSELAEKIMSGRASVPDRFDDLIHTVACKAAIKAGKETSQMELQSLCEKVINDPEVRACPHGRPTTVRLTKYELDKLFKRVNQ